VRVGGVLDVGGVEVHERVERVPALVLGGGDDLAAEVPVLAGDPQRRLKPAWRTANDAIGLLPILGFSR
jgi:hypothetical protein